MFRELASRDCDRWDVFLETPDSPSKFRTRQEAVLVSRDMLKNQIQIFGQRTTDKESERCPVLLGLSYVRHSWTLRQSQDMGAHLLISKSPNSEPFLLHIQLHNHDMLSD
jgi:hypothetical protein